VDSPSRQIVKHGAVFGFGAILSRLGSVVLLPIYIHYLDPSEYGVMAILDITINLLAIVVGAGIATAATRAHFTGEGESHRDQVWWTAILMLCGVASVILCPVFVARRNVAAAAFGADVSRGGTYLAIALLTLWLTSVMYAVDAYFRALKASTFLVSVNAIRLAVNVLLNVIFLIWLKMGLAGILWGNLIGVAIGFVLQSSAFLSARGRPTFDRRIARMYARFGWPLVVFGLLSAVLHEADRFLLRLFVSLHDIGVYAVAYQIAQGVNTLVLVPFGLIWGTIIYEIARQPDAKVTYTKVFKQFVFGLSLVLFLAALLARPILGFIAPADYAPAANIVPVLCLGYLFFSLHEHFKVPALLANRTASLLPVVSLAAATNVALNLLLIPAIGLAGAAWSTVLTFVIFSLGGLVQYRRIDYYDYPFGICAAATAGMAVTFVAYHFVSASAGTLLQLLLASTVWLVWAGALLGGTMRALAAPAAARLRTMWTMSPRVPIPLRSEEVQPVRSLPSE
jgi:O-antigen/teichoic acid export membrane protein